MSSRSSATPGACRRSKRSRRSYPGRLAVHPGDALEADWPALIAGSEPVDDRRQPALRHRLAAACSLARDGAVAAVVRPHGADVSARGCRSHRCRAAHEGLRPPLRSCAVANARQGRHDAAARSVHAGAESMRPPSSNLRPIPMPEPQCRVETLARVTAAAFGQRRKMLRSSLKQLTPMPELLLREAEIAPERRAEELTVSEFAKLASIVDRGDRTSA